MKRSLTYIAVAIMALSSSLSGCARTDTVAVSGELTDEQIENIVRRSYQYVAMYNVITKNAMLSGAQTNTDGWNQCSADTELKDHTYRAIARPNNDTLYAGCMLDLRSEPVVVEYPAFDSKYVALETSAYDHYCDIPLSTRKGDFREPTRILYYTARTQGYSGEPVEGVDTVLEVTGDFVIAFLRAMPHAAEPQRMARNVAALQEVKCQTLSEYRGAGATPAEAPGFPASGSDFDVFENNLLEVMQFVFNHTTFDPGDEIDQGVLAAYKPLGIEPGEAYDPETVATIDGARFRQIAERIASAEMAKATDAEFQDENLQGLFQPKGQMTLRRLLYQSVIGPIGLPATEAVYPAIVTTDGAPMNADHDYVIRMTADELPPAGAFWSVTLYDTENGFFIPNDRKKYSVGENAGMKLDADGGIEIYIAAEKPRGVPEENWLPLERGDYDIDAIMRIYAPDLDRFATWTAPKAEKL